jgi:hypothetical protein
MQSENASRITIILPPPTRLNVIQIISFPTLDAEEVQEELSGIGQRRRLVATAEDPIE